MKKLEEIKKNIENYISRHGESPFSPFIKKMESILSLIRKCETEFEKTPNIIVEARINCAISLVTTLEVFLKDYIVHLIDIQKYDYTKALSEKLLNPKFNLEQVEYIIKQNYQIGDVFVQYCNCLNIESFFKIISRIIFGKEKEPRLKKDFLKFEFIYQGAKCTCKYEDIEKIKSLIQLRHSLVHDINFHPEKRIADLVGNFQIILKFVAGLDDYFLNLFKTKYEYETNPDNQRFTFIKPKNDN